MDKFAVVNRLLSRLRSIVVAAGFPRFARALLTLTPVIVLLQALPALADEFEPVNEAARAKTDPNPFILGAYGFIWVAVLVYVVMLARGLGKAQGEVEALRRRVDAGK